MEDLTRDEIDVLGEISNICVGGEATNLSLMVNRRVDISTPKIETIGRSAALDGYEKTCIFVQVSYVKGLSGNNVFILKERDVKCLTDLMMGGDGTNTDCELNDFHLSAISEVMNQMMGASATSMATMLDILVDISTPRVSPIDVESVRIFEHMFESKLDRFVKVSFRMVVEGLIDSNMVQLYPVDFAHELCKHFQEATTKA